MRLFWTTDRWSLVPSAPFQQAVIEKLTRALQELFCNCVSAQQEAVVGEPRTSAAMEKPQSNHRVYKLVLTGGNSPLMQVMGGFAPALFARKSIKTRVLDAVHNKWAALVISITFPYNGSGRAIPDPGSVLPAKGIQQHTHVAGDL